MASMTTWDLHRLDLLLEGVCTRRVSLGSRQESPEQIPGFHAKDLCIGRPLLGSCIPCRVAICAPYYATIKYAYEHLPSKNPVLQTMVDAHCYGFVEKSGAERSGKLELRSQLSHDFLVYVMVRYM